VVLERLKALVLPHKPLNSHMGFKGNRLENGMRILAVVWIPVIYLAYRFHCYWFVVLVEVELQNSIQPKLIYYSDLVFRNKDHPTGHTSNSVFGDI
jgi:hypothetical protein